MEKAQVEATLRGERLQRGSYEIRALSATAEWNRQHLDISHFEWSDTKGSFAARADWNQDTNNVNFQLRSSVDLKNFLDACGLGEPLAGIEFQARPLVEIYGSLNPTGGSIQARCDRTPSLANSEIQECAFLRSGCMIFHGDGERTFVRNLRSSPANGSGRADLLDAPGDFRLNIESTISPAAIPGTSSTGIKRVCETVGMATAAGDSSQSGAATATRKVGKATERSVWAAADSAAHG